MQGVVDWSESGLSLPASLSTAPTVAESRGLTDALWRAHFTAPSTATSPDAMITPGASISPAAANPSGIEPHSMPTPPSLPAAPSLHNSVQSPAAAPSLPAPFTFQFHEPTTSATPIQAPPPAPISKPKRKRVLPSDKRKREKVRSCRRCNSPECDGKVNILFCATQCTVPCAKCGHFERCKGVDKGRICKYPDDSGNLYRAKKAKTSSESIART
ncbi:hypothetical protein DFP72DRAFT_920538 [Ephemerocybe angulata]|uniref:Uncharacterized protein n=1 Tax=Ephemerocybe angulata TaxID=980116 RepID=A0A8H6HHG7_9AGAR|nr:hypothetical protein DFP72DRAFT_920538 [Tulosesus angulatus]